MFYSAFFRLFTFAPRLDKARVCKRPLLPPVLAVLKHNIHGFEKIARAGQKRRLAM
jgi:hypothetical protein